MGKPYERERQRLDRLLVQAEELHRQIEPAQKKLLRVMREIRALTIHLADQRELPALDRE